MECLQFVAALGLNLGGALMAGALGSLVPRTLGTSAWARHASATAAKAFRIGAVGAFVSSLALLWWQAAAMGDVGLSLASHWVMPVLLGTRFGHSWLIGTAALTTAIVMSRARLADCESDGGWVVAGIAVAVFIGSRSAVSHSAVDGLCVSSPIDWMHRFGIGLWSGEVFLASLLITSLGDASDAERLDRVRYIQSLSTTATFALGVVVATGAFMGWGRLESNAHSLVSSFYGRTLLLKLSMVAVAAALGGLNRFLVMPGLLCDLRSTSAFQGRALGIGRFALILKVESAVLLGVLLLATVLGVSAPP